MIRFRYGALIPAHGAAAVAHTSTATSAAAPAKAAVVTAATSSAPLPARFQPRAISDEEMECVRLGGAVASITKTVFVALPLKKGDKRA